MINFITIKIFIYLFIFKKTFCFNIMKLLFFHPFEFIIFLNICHMLDVHTKTTYLLDVCVSNNIPNFVKIKNQL
jgi:hypothetical protein